MSTDTSESLAADLAGARVDPNEAQKALAYLCSKKDGKEFFAYLRAINQNGGAVIRSGQTLNYYRDLLAACERHLRGMDAEEMAQTLGWAIRLLRYYRAVPEAEQIRTAPAAAPRPAHPAETPHQAAAPQPARSPATQPPATRQAAPQPTAPQIPEVGDIFGGTVLAVDPQGVRVKVKNLNEDNIAVGVIKTEDLAGKQYQIGNIARVEVISVRTTPSGLQVLDLKPAPKKQK